MVAIGVEDTAMDGKMIYTSCNGILSSWWAIGVGRTPLASMVVPAGVNFDRLSVVVVVVARVTGSRGEIVVVCSIGEEGIGMSCTHSTDVALNSIGE